MRIVVLGLSITSSWGNGHATTYRALLRGLQRRGHEIFFLERDKPWYRDNRDLPEVPYAKIALYCDLAELEAKYARHVRDADLVILGSYVPDGVAVGDWVLGTARGVTAFYDIDTPITMAKLARADEEYLAARAIPHFGLYLSFTGGPTLRRIEREYGARMARPLYCSVDPDLYFPDPRPLDYLLGYLGTYSADRQPALGRLLTEPARKLSDHRFLVAGPMYPEDVDWPPNVERVDHLPPAQHRTFYNSQRYTLNITRADMVAAGYSPSVRLFEAAACGTPILSDYWTGMEELFVPGREILIARSADEAVKTLTRLTESARSSIGSLARNRVLAHHTALHRAIQLEQYCSEFQTLTRPGRSIATAAPVRHRRLGDA